MAFRVSDGIWVKVSTNFHHKNPSGPYTKHTVRHYYSVFERSLMVFYDESLLMLSHICHQSLKTLLFFFSKLSIAMTKFCYLFNNFTSYHLHDFLLKLSIAMAKFCYFYQIWSRIIFTIF